jgi:hypothetical protein
VPDNAAPVRQFLFAEPGHLIHAHGKRMILWYALHHGHERGFARTAATVSVAVALAVPVGSVDLDVSAQPMRPVTLDHRLHQHVLHQPGRVVAHAQLPPQ